MISRQVSEHKAAALRSLLQAVLSGQDVNKDGFYSIQAKNDTLFMEPVNSSPYIFRAPDVVFVFDSKPGSGTDFLRQRVVAQNFFDNLTGGVPSSKPSRKRCPA